MSERMFRLLRADEIDCRVSTVNDRGLTLLLYKDARVDQNILDETVGPERWQRAHEMINGSLFCNVGIWVDRRNDGYGEWVWKQDVGTESYTEKEKGQASDAFKRACFNWGIGRELYTAPFIWIPKGKYTESKNRQDKPTTFDQFDVKGIDYKDGRISFLEIWNMKKRSKVFEWELDPADAKPETQAEIMEDAEKRTEEASERTAVFEQINALLSATGKDLAWLLGGFKKKGRKCESLKDLTDKDLAFALRNLEKMANGA